MDKPGLHCYCCQNKNGCICCKPQRTIDLNAALHELGILSNVAEAQENILQENKLKESRTWIEQTPPLWINSPLSSNSLGHPLRVDIETSKETPQQPPNSPVSPQLPLDHFRIREVITDPLPQRCEWDGRLLGGQRMSINSRHRMLSGPNASDRYSERLRDRTSWTPYRIPRPKLRGSGHCSRMRTISATLHEETERLTPSVDASQLLTATDALQSMFIGEGLANTTDTADSNSNFPRSRSMDNLERGAMDVVSVALDSVSEKIKKLHVT